MIASYVVAPAYAGEDHGQKPVTVDDYVTVQQGVNGTVTVDVLANDSDRDGDTISLCGIKPIKNAYGIAMQSNDGDKVTIDPNGQNAASYDVNYAVCDDWYRVTTGVLHVKTVKVKKTKVALVHGKSLRGVNSAQFLVLLYVGPHRGQTDRRITLKADSRRTFKLPKRSLQRSSVTWWASMKLKDGGWIDAGHGTIKLH